MTRWTIANLTLALALGTTTLYAETELKAGIARVEITPSAYMPMYGYANRKCGPANGTHDPLFAKAVVLEAGDSRIAIVTLDAGMMMSDDLLRDVRSKLNIPVLLLSASHTHSGPYFLHDDGSPTKDATANAYLAEVNTKVFHAIEEASKTMFPASLSVGRGSLQLGYNRLLL